MGHVAHVGDEFKGEGALGRPRCRGDGIMHPRKTGQKGVGWMHLALDRDQHWALVSMVMNHWVPQKVGNFLTDGLLASQGGLMICAVGQSVRRHLA
jgi:hypothetical protein